MSGRRPDPFNGVLVIDKPTGMTSHDVVDAVRRAAGMRRVGHTGTLDPDATGVLVVCLGKATRLARFIQAGRKTYMATVRFGATTTTQDAAGDVVDEADAGHLTRADVAEALPSFRGVLQQIPPMVSAVKVDGERLHEKARRGEEVEREPREVTIHALTFENFRPGPRPEADLTVICSAGTYVRTLAHDLGQHLGVGGHLTQLRRTWNAGYSDNEAWPLHVISEAGDEDRLGDLVIPIERSLPGLRKVEVDVAAAGDVAVGRRLPARGTDGPYAVTHAGRLLAVYADREGESRPEVVLVTPDDVPATTSEGDGS